MFHVRLEAMRKTDNVMRRAAHWAGSGLVALCPVAWLVVIVAGVFLPGDRLVSARGTSSGTIQFFATLAANDITLTIEGEEGTAGSGTDADGCSGSMAAATTTMQNLGWNADGANDVNFGNVDSLCVATPSQGDCCVINSTSARLVATLTVTVNAETPTYTSWAVDLCHDPPGGTNSFDTSTSDDRLHWAIGTSTNWTGSGAGTSLEMTAAAGAPCDMTSPLGSTNLAGLPLTVKHQIAFRLDSTDTTTKAVRVRYRAVGVP